MKVIMRLHVLLCLAVMSLWSMGLSSAAAPAGYAYPEDRPAASEQENYIQGFIDQRLTEEQRRSNMQAARAADAIPEYPPDWSQEEIQRYRRLYEGHP